MSNYRAVKRVMLACFAILISAHMTLGQSNEYIESGLTNSTVLGVFEIDDEIVIAVSNGLNLPLDPHQEFALIFYRMELLSNGTEFVLNEIHRIQMEEGYQVFSIDYIQNTKEWICVKANNVFNLNGREISISIFSSSYDLVADQEMYIQGFPEKFYIDTHRDKTAILGWVSPPVGDKLVYAEYRHNQPGGLSPFFVGQSQPLGMFWITSMSFDQVTGHMLTFYYNGIAILDSSLYQVEVYDFLSGIMTSDHGEVIRVGDYYYSHGARDTSWSDGRRALVLQKYDTTFSIIASDLLGWPNQDNYPFIFNSIEHQDNILLIGGNLDGPFNGIDFFNRKKKFYLAKYDLDINQIWYKEYGGDDTYSLFGLKLLEDLNVLAYGFITDTLSDYRYAYLMYVNENGDIVSSIEVPSSPGPPLAVINPGDDQLTILNPDALDARIVMTTLDGKIVLHTDVQSDMMTVDLHAWPAGMYPYIFYIGDKPVKSGKWVKKE